MSGPKRPGGITPAQYQILMIGHALVSGGIIVALYGNLFPAFAEMSSLLKALIAGLLVMDLIMFPLLLKGAVRK